MLRVSQSLGETLPREARYGTVLVPVRWTAGGQLLMSIHSLSMKDPIIWNLTMNFKDKNAEEYFTLIVWRWSKFDRVRPCWLCFFNVFVMASSTILWARYCRVGTAMSCYHPCLLGACCFEQRNNAHVGWANNQSLWYIYIDWNKGKTFLFLLTLWAACWTCLFFWRTRFSSCEDQTLFGY